jgi:hypothetical protein
MKKIIDPIQNSHSRPGKLKKKKLFLNKNRNSKEINIKIKKNKKIKLFLKFFKKKSNINGYKK